MAAPDLPSNVPRQPDRPGVPIRTSSSHYAEAVKSASAATSPTSPTSSTVPIPDGRKNSVGEVLASPTESWKPDFKRRQSYKQEDFKREMQMSGVIVQAEEGSKDGTGDGRGGGVGKHGESGFTEA